MHPGKTFQGSKDPGAGLLSGSVVKNLPANVKDTRDPSPVLGSGRSPRERNGNPLQYSCLENHMDRGVWRATVYGFAKESDMIID